MNSIDIFYKDNSTIKMISNFINEILEEELVIVCIGSDKFIFDSLGPLVGTYLEKHNTQKNIHIYGTLETPINAKNIKVEINKIKRKHPNIKILAIDACLGKYHSIGRIIIDYGPLHPGKGMKKNLQPVGDYNIKGITATLHSDIVRLNLVVEMAKVISMSIIEAIDMKNK